jgi:hypothetical protein
LDSGKHQNKQTALPGFAQIQFTNLQTQERVYYIYLHYLRPCINTSAA